MKKISLISGLLLGAVLVVSVNSCSTTKGINGVQAVSRIANIASTAKEIADVLGNTLGLSGGQKNSVTGIFSDYIGGTNNIASLFNTDKKSYISKLGVLNSGALGKLKNILTVAQYAKLLGLGGKKATSGSLLNDLAGGSSLSSGATSVLTGLLASGLK